MRRLILITVLMLASASAFAGESRSLTLASNLTEPTVTSAPQLPVKQVATKLAEQAAPMTTQVQSDAPAVQAPATTTTTETPAATATTTTTETAKPATTADTTTKPATKPVKKVSRRESDESKARRIAARYGVYW